ncbi:hypothetical protein [Pseudomonas sp. sp1636]|uniref:hypothetical protein n=1 Tax=Pseudomonas sp. sp1636 TaxID=3036707 RepID=UPI0035B657E7
MGHSGRCFSAAVCRPVRGCVQRQRRGGQCRPVCDSSRGRCHYRQGRRRYSGGR